MAEIIRIPRALAAYLLGGRPKRRTQSVLINTQSVLINAQTVVNNTQSVAINGQCSELRQDSPCRPIEERGGTV